MLVLLAILTAAFLVSGHSEPNELLPAGLIPNQNSQDVEKKITIAHRSTLKPAPVFENLTVSLPSSPNSIVSVGLPNTRGSRSLLCSYNSLITCLLPFQEYLEWINNQFGSRLPVFGKILKAYKDVDCQEANSAFQLLSLDNKSVGSDLTLIFYQKILSPNKELEEELNQRIPIGTTVQDVTRVCSRCQKKCKRIDSVSLDCSLDSIKSRQTFVGDLEAAIYESLSDSCCDNETKVLAANLEFPPVYMIEKFYPGNFNSDQLQFEPFELLGHRWEIGSFSTSSSWATGCSLGHATPYAKINGRWFHFDSLPRKVIADVDPSKVKHLRAVFFHVYPINDSNK